MAKSWHWQERFDALDPEEACRRQVLKVQKQISFPEWLQHKKRESRQNQENINGAAETAETKQRECDVRFFEWVRKKQREKSKQRKDTTSETTQKKSTTRQDQLSVKPRSLHVNPVIKGHRTKSPAHVATITKAKLASPEQNATIYAEWERRKKREARVKRKHEKLTQQLQQNAERLQHLTRWQKKDVVCAYSTNHRSAHPHPVTQSIQNVQVA